MPAKKTATRRRKPTLPTVKRTTAPGIPVAWVEDDSFMAALQFRVGRADETLLNSGIAHVVEHLAMSKARDRRIEANAFVDPVRTVFYGTGDRDRVLDFLVSVAEALADLPVDRLEHELGVLQAEAARGSSGVDGAMRGYRFGARGHGLLGYNEVGFSHLTPDDVPAWAERYTADNAVAWMTGRPPAGWRLPLPKGGGRLLLPDPEPLDFAYPAYVNDGEALVAVSMVGRRSASLSAAMRILQDRLQRRLRTETGRSYEISSDYQPLSADTAWCLAGADFRPEHGREVSALFWDTVTELAEQGPTAEEVEDDIAKGHEVFTGPDSTHGVLETTAFEELLRGAPYPVAEVLAHLAANTPESVGQAFAEARESALLWLPEGASPPPGLEEFPLLSPSAVTGRTYRPRGGRNPNRLVVGDRGVSLTSGNRIVTVLWDDCVAMLRWPKSARALLSLEGMYVRVSAYAWKDGLEAVQAIDRAVPGDKVVLMRPSVYPHGAWLDEGGRHEDDDRFVSPSWEHDGWRLPDLVHRAGSDGLPPPAPEDEIACLDKGDHAHVLVETRAEDGSLLHERATVMVAAVKEEFFVGVLEEASGRVPVLKEHTGLAFSPHHIVGVTRRRVAGRLWRGFGRATKKF